MEYGRIEKVLEEIDKENVDETNEENEQKEEFLEN